MIDRISNHFDAPARLMMSLIFILSGYGKISAFEATQGYMEAFGLPGILLLPTILFEIGAGLSLLAGFATRYVAILLAGFSLVTAMVFHRELSDQIQMVMFLKNVAMTGGLLIVAKYGAGALSVDKWLSGREG